MRAEGDSKFLAGVWGPYSYGEVTTDPLPTPEPTPEPPPPSRLAAPVVDVIPVRERKAWLIWKNVDGANEYYVRIRRKGETSWPTKGDYNHHTGRGFPGGEYSYHLIYLDRIIQTGPNSKEGLAHNTAYEFQVQARHGSDDTKHSAFSDVITIVDSPILSANGDAGGVPIANQLLGMIKVKWNRVGQAGDDVQYNTAVAQALW